MVNNTGIKLKKAPDKAIVKNCKNGICPDHTEDE